MLNRPTFRPHCVALAVAVALGHAAYATAQEPPAALVTLDGHKARIDSFLKDPDTKVIPVTRPESGADGIALKLDATHDLVSVSRKGRFDGIVDGGEGINALQLETANASELGESRNFDHVRIKRGEWTLSGTGDFPGGAFVADNATLNNRGHVLGQVSVDRRATLRGNGEAGHLLVAGKLEVNTLHGAPRVRGDLELQKTAELAYGINAAGSGETISVGGTARLGDATLNIIAAPGDYPETGQHTIIEAGKVEGRFGQVTSDLAFLSPTVNYAEQTVGLTYARNNVPLESVAENENGRELAESLEEPVAGQPAGTDRPPTAPETPGRIPTAPSGPTAVTAKAAAPGNAAVNALLTTNRITASRALDQLSAGGNANLAGATLGSVAPVGASLLSAMRQTGDGPSVERNPPHLANGGETGSRVWLQALGDGGTLDRGESASTLRHATQGLLLGADWAADEHWRLGMLAGQSRTRLDGQQYEGRLDSWHLGAYALRQSGPMAIRLGAAYGNHAGVSKRSVAYNGFSDRPKGKYEAHTGQAFAELGYNLGHGRFSAEPFAGLGIQRYRRDSHTEKGGDASLQVHGQTQQNVSSTLGLRLAYVKALDDGLQLTPRFSAGWKHTYGDVQSHTRQKLAAGGRDFTVEGAALDRNNLTLDAGLELAVSPRHSLGLGYNGDIGHRSRRHGVSGQWRMAF
ncbi:autotransporter domain-containing protein [Pseudomonas sp. COR58]|uniref:Autotransporter domain-containing protein n=1 Tax=Pseudomonas ekonensis TaxID=2842353 RepID=A0ABS6PL91_9PSED|nr:autotransporter outer membrane beta-barrel domain-containing protein [Pseudomonas ekonensis]MBV4461200.1 autotransporter domain-containing protein [Pseudomonas ekonensis]